MTNVGDAGLGYTVMRLWTLNIVYLAIPDTIYFYQLNPLTKSTGTALIDGCPLTHELKWFSARKRTSIWCQFFRRDRPGCSKTIIWNILRRNKGKGNHHFAVLSMGLSTGFYPTKARANRRNGRVAKHEEERKAHGHNVGEGLVPSRRNPAMLWENVRRIRTICEFAEHILW